MGISRAISAVLRTDWALVAALVLPLLLVNLLPPDTSLKQVRQEGLLSVCVPQDYPPLATPEKANKGIEIELIGAVTQEMGLQLRLNPNAAIGRDVNPRNWRVTRAQCQVLAGGVVDSPVTQAFLERTPPYLETGWALIRPESTQGLQGQKIGFFAGISGLDRIALGQFLRQQGAEAVSVANEAELVAGLEQGRFVAGVGEALSLRSIAGDKGWKVEWLPKELGRYSLIFGLWKGDLTLKRAIVGALQKTLAEGKLEQILQRYKLVDIAPSCSICSSK